MGNYQIKAAIFLNVKIDKKRHLCILIDKFFPPRGNIMGLCP